MIRSRAALVLATIGLGCSGTSQGVDESKIVGTWAAIETSTEGQLQIKTEAYEAFEADKTYRSALRRTSTQNGVIITTIGPCARGTYTVGSTQITARVEVTTWRAVTTGNEPTATKETKDLSLQAETVDSDTLKIGAVGQTGRVYRRAAAPKDFGPRFKECEP
jgi:hypothetical protein